MSDRDHQSGTDDAAEQALRHGLKASPLSAEALQRIRRATEAEWRAAVHDAAPPRRRWLSFAAAASVALLVAAGVFRLYWSDQRAATGAVLGTIARAAAPGVAEQKRLGGDVSLAEGASVRVFQELQARGEALIELAGGGNLRVARATEFEIVAPDAVRLHRGEIYVDIPPGANDDRFRVVTRAGEFRHVGTQFSVAVANDQTRLRVREGAVAWHAPEGESTIEAGTEMTIGSGGVDRRPIAISGRDWAWAESLAPDFDIQDRPLREFLEWFSRETGRELVIVDDVARSQVGGIHMHGNVQGLTALEALAAVMASTTLHYELPEGAIRVSSPRDSRPTR